MPGTATGVLIIRTWVEPGSAEPLRFHIRLSTDISAGIERSLTVTQTAAATSIVEAGRDRQRPQSGLPERSALLAALDLSQDKLYGHVKVNKNRTTFLAFCRYLRSLYPFLAGVGVLRPGEESTTWTSM